jgi:hypothetical protein
LLTVAIAILLQTPCIASSYELFSITGERFRVSKIIIWRSGGNTLAMCVSNIKGRGKRMEFEIDIFFVYVLDIPVINFSAFIGEQYVIFLFVFYMENWK